MNNLILIGEIEKAFVSDQKPEIKNAKFVIVSEDNENLKLLLHYEGYPYEYHAEAVMQHMKNKNLNEIYCHGGGKISISKTIVFHAKSYAFGTANDENIRFVSEKIWPGIEIDIMTMGKKTEGGLYSKEQIQYLCDNT